MRGILSLLRCCVWSLSFSLVSLSLSAAADSLLLTTQKNQKTFSVCVCV